MSMLAFIAACSMTIAGGPAPHEPLSEATADEFVTRLAESVERAIDARRGVEIGFEWRVYGDLEAPAGEVDWFGDRLVAQTSAACTFVGLDDRFRFEQQWFSDPSNPGVEGYRYDYRWNGAIGVRAFSDAFGAPIGSLSVVGTDGGQIVLMLYPEIVGAWLLSPFPNTHIFGRPRSLAQLLAGDEGAKARAFQNDDGTRSILISPVPTPNSMAAEIVASDDAERPRVVGIVERFYGGIVDMADLHAGTSPDVKTEVHFEFGDERVPELGDLPRHARAFVSIRAPVSDKWPTGRRVWRFELDLKSAKRADPRVADFEMPFDVPNAEYGYDAADIVWREGDRWINLGGRILTLDDDAPPVAGDVISSIESWVTRGTFAELTSREMRLITDPAAVASPEPDAPIVVEIGSGLDGTFDAGTIDIQRGPKPVRHAFELRNSGDAPKRISRIDISCGCLSAAASAEVVPPGGSITVDLETSAAVIGRIHQDALVHFDSGESVHIELFATGWAPWKVSLYRPRAYIEAADRSLHMRLFLRDTSGRGATDARLVDAPDDVVLVQGDWIELEPLDPTIGRPRHAVRDVRIDCSRHAGPFPFTCRLVLDSGESWDIEVRDLDPLVTEASRPMR